MHNKIIYKDQQFKLNEMLKKCVELAIYELELEIGSEGTQKMLYSYGSICTGGKVFVEEKKLMRQIPMEQLKLFCDFFKTLKFEIVKKDGLPEISVSFTFNTD